MFWFNKKKSSELGFMLDYPQISIVPQMPSVIASLKSSNTPYKVVADGYITFSGKAFDSDISLVFGVHFASSIVDFIEIFRPIEYLQADNYDIYNSFSELSEILKNKYGQPKITTSLSINGRMCEQWVKQNYIVNHYIFERFSLEEHLHINFYK